MKDIQMWEGLDLKYEKGGTEEIWGKRTDICDKEQETMGSDIFKEK